MRRKSYRQELDERFAELRGDPQAHAAVLRVMGPDFGQIAREALTISEDNPSLKAAFDRAGLDHRNPVHWRMLLEVFADVLLKPSPNKAADRAVGITNGFTSCCWTWMNSGQSVPTPPYRNAATG
jgi:hypothetical protein